MPLMGGFTGRHTGIDLRAPLGTPVIAAADGEVGWVREDRRAGRMVVVIHAEELATAYLHLSETAVHPGQSLRRGEVLGRSGMSGNATTPHLHFAVCRRAAGRCRTGPDGGWADPAGYWVEDGPCFDPGRAYAAAPIRFTYPLACRPASG
jgi:murein DD-endopeptidase MepM/ murein hydrolase activator NlpD